MSAYADYLREMCGNQIIETEYGFVTYKYMDDKKTVYITDIYIRPAFRKSNCAMTISDMVVEEAKKKNYSVLLGSVTPSANGSTISLRLLLAYGMTLCSSDKDIIFFRKDI